MNRTKPMSVCICLFFIRIDKYLIYVHKCGRYLSLSFKSADDKYFYVLPSGDSGKPLYIYSVDYIKREFRNRNLFVFQHVTVSCSNRQGPCPFQRLMNLT